jgi:hypothetical protein
MSFSMTPADAATQFRADVAMLEQNGIFLPEVKSYLPDGWGGNFAIAMDALPALTTVTNSGIPSWLTTLIDPSVIEVLFAPNNGSKILGEVKKGNWLDETIMFPFVENVGEVSSYGDYSNNGHTGVNTNWPQRQAYLFQIIKEYGEREAERAGLARINWAAQIDKSAAIILDKFLNLTYFFGLQNLQNFGLLNDPSLPASDVPGVKAAAQGGNNAWIVSGAVQATANEIYTDIQTIFETLVSNTAGLIDMQSKLVLAMSPSTQVALTTTNTFNVNVYDLLKKNFPNIRFETAIQYGARTASNPQGVVGGNLVQMIAEDIEGDQTGYCAFNEKMRAHTIVRDLSSYKQKMTSGTWGAIILRPMGFASMLGV